MREELNRHRETFDSDNLRDYFDAFLLEEQRNKDNPNSMFTGPSFMPLLVFYYLDCNRLRMVINYFYLLTL